MIYKVEYSKSADKTLRKWKKSNPVFKTIGTSHHALCGKIDSNLKEQKDALFFQIAFS